jgi:hypothetical protein
LRYWWVNQNQTYRHEIAGGYLWSPKRKANDARNHYYECMREVAVGDVAFSFVGTKILAIDVAQSYCFECPKPLEFGTAGMNWENIGWKVRVNFVQFQNQVRPKDHMGILASLLPTKYSPLRPNGDGLQNVYLAEVGLLCPHIARLVAPALIVRFGRHSEQMTESSRLDRMSCMKMVPNDRAFKSCYGFWLDYVARIIVSSDKGTSFGIFGPWGSGKSSACAALAKEIYAAASMAKRLVQCVTVDAFRLSTLSRGEQEEELQTLFRKEIFLEESRPVARRTAIYRSLRNIVAPLLTASGRPVEGSALGILAKAGEDRSTSEASEAVVPEALEVDRIVLFLDDLDRCNPQEAIAVMANVNGWSTYDNTNVVLACDPDVLAAHVAATCGISVTSGRDVLSKYVHVPFTLPMGRSPEHKDALEQALSASSCSDVVKKAALDSIGFVPIREILGAVLQAELWLHALRKGNSEIAGALAPVCLFLAIVGNIAPAALRLASRSLDGMLALRGVFSSDPTGRAKPPNVNEPLASLRARLDLFELGNRVLGHAPDDHFHVLVEMLATHGPAG